MTDEKKMKNAQNMYNSLCKMLDEKGFTYQRHEEDLVITFAASGEDLPMHFVLSIDAKWELIRLLSLIPVVFDEDKRIIGAVATCRANYCLADGSFDYDYTEGKVLFRMTSSYADSLISPDLFGYMMAIAYRIVEEYNDQFLALSNGSMTIDEFFQKN